MCFCTDSGRQTSSCVQIENRYKANSMFESVINLFQALLSLLHSCFTERKMLFCVVFVEYLSWWIHALRQFGLKRHLQCRHFYLAIFSGYTLGMLRQLSLWSPEICNEIIRFCRFGISEGKKAQHKTSKRQNANANSNATNNFEWNEFKRETGQTSRRLKFYERPWDLHVATSFFSRSLVLLISLQLDSRTDQNEVQINFVPLLFFFAIHRELQNISRSGKQSHSFFFSR